MEIPLRKSIEARIAQRYTLCRPVWRSLAATWPPELFGPAIATAGPQKSLLILAS